MSEVGPLDLPSLRLPLDHAALRYGHRRGHLTDGDVVRLATRAWEEGDRSPRIQALMLLLPDEHGSVPELLAPQDDAGPAEQPPDGRARRTWVCLLLGELLRADLPLDELFAGVDGLHADHEHPSSMDHLVSYAPVATAREAGRERLHQRIVDVVRAEEGAPS